MTLLLFFIGFVLLIAGAEFLVRGSSQLAAGLGIPPLVIGLTIVAYGTGSPELVVGIISSIYGQTDIALGNVIGSNVINILAILGLSAVICPLVVHQQLVRLDVPIMVAISLVILICGYFGVIPQWMGILLLIGMVLYTVIVFYTSNKGGENEEFIEEYRIDGKLSIKRIVIDLIFIGAGIVMLIFGSDWLVKGSVYLATIFGVSELIISLTIVAIGTSLPELATSIAAALKGKRDIAVGNVVGSNIFNILAVLGAAAAINPDGIPIPPAAAQFDIPVMTAVAIACLPIFFTGHEISRWEGALFVFYYVAYNCFLILTAIGSSYVDPLRAAMLYFVLPLTVLTLGIGIYRSVGASKKY